MWNPFRVRLRSPSRTQGGAVALVALRGCAAPLTLGFGMPPLRGGLPPRAASPHGGSSTLRESGHGQGPEGVRWIRGS